MANAFFSSCMPYHFLAIQCSERDGREGIANGFSSHLASLACRAVEHLVQVVGLSVYVQHQAVPSPKLGDDHDGCVQQQNG